MELGGVPSESTKKLATQLPAGANSPDLKSAVVLVMSA